MANNTNKEQYIIVSGGMTDVQQAVNRAIADGYELQGGLCAYHVVSSNGNVKFLFAQAMVLPKVQYEVKSENQYWVDGNGCKF